MSDLPDTETTGEREPKLSTADLAGAAPRDASPEPRSPEQRSFDAADAAGGDRVADGNAAQSTAPLLAQAELAGFRTRWTDVQTGFVDEPRAAVEQADGLVAEAIKRLAEMFAKERADLEAQWDRGDRVSTEDLRLALQRYRAFFTRLLSV